MQEKKRIYKYDNVKALLIFLVVLGHMTTDYVSDSHLVRWTTLWIYTFHMPAFIFISGLVHKQYITEERASLGIKGETLLRWDKVLTFFLCGWALKIFLQFTRSLMGQNPIWHWFEEPGIPWYLFVMAEYELLFFLMRRIDSKVKPVYMIGGAFALSAAIGYFPAVGDTLCLSRMINFLPIYMLGYYLDMKKFLPLLEGRGYKDPSALTVVTTTTTLTAGSQQENSTLNKSHFGETAGDIADQKQSPSLKAGCVAAAEKQKKQPAEADRSTTAAAAEHKANQRRAAIYMLSWLGIAVSMLVCALGKWGMYSWRKWFTGRRSYEYLQYFFEYAVKDGWWIRLAVWAFALALTFCLLVVIPDKDMGFITTVGSRTLNIYFWHRPLCYLFRNWAVLPRLCVLFGGTYNAAVAGVSPGLAFGGPLLSMIAAYAVYILIAAAMTAFFSLSIFNHPCSDLMKLSEEIIRK